MEFVNTVYFVDASSTQVLAKRFRASRLSGETTTNKRTGYSQKRRVYSCDFVDKSLLVCKILISCTVDKILLT